MPRTRQTPEQLSPAGSSSSTLNGLAGEVLTLSEAATYLRLAEADVLQLVKEQGLPARQLVHEWRFLKSALQDWLRMSVPTLQANKATWLSLAGKYKDDPELLQICEDAYRQRGRPMTEDE